MSQPNKSRARMRVPRMNSCLYADFGFGARCFQVVVVGSFIKGLYTTIHWFGNHKRVSLPSRFLIFSRRLENRAARQLEAGQQFRLACAQVLDSAPEKPWFFANRAAHRLVRRCLK